MQDSTGRWLKTILLLILAAASLWVLGRMGNLIKLVMIAALLAYVLDPIVGHLEAHGVGRTLATLVVFVIIGALIYLSVSLLLPHVSAELKAVRAGISAGKAVNIINNLETTIETRLAFLDIHDLDLIGNLQDFSKHAANEVYSYFLDVMGILWNFIIVPFIMFFFLKDGRGFIKSFVSLVPNRYFEMTLSLIHKTDRQLGGYIRGQFMDSVIIGGLTVLALWALDVKYFLLLGVVLGISNIIPFIGPIIGSIPAIAVALIETGDPYKALTVFIAMVIIQVIDNGMVKPVVVARMVSLHPVVVILAVIIGGKFFGVMGMILSIPVTGTIKLVAEQFTANIRKYRHQY